MRVFMAGDACVDCQRRHSAHMAIASSSIPKTLPGIPDLLRMAFNSWDFLWYKRLWSVNNMRNCSCWSPSVSTLSTTGREELPDASRAARSSNVCKVEDCMCSARSPPVDSRANITMLHWGFLVRVLGLVISSLMSLQPLLFQLDSGVSWVSIR